MGLLPIENPLPSVPTPSARPHLGPWRPGSTLHQPLCFCHQVIAPAVPRCHRMNSVSDKAKVCFSTLDCRDVTGLEQVCTLSDSGFTCPCGCAARTRYKCQPQAWRRRAAGSCRNTLSTSINRGRSPPAMAAIACDGKCRTNRPTRSDHLPNCALMIHPRAAKRQTEAGNAACLIPA